MLINGNASTIHNSPDTPNHVNKIKQLLNDSYPLNLAQTNKNQVLKYFLSSWKLYEWLFSGLNNSLEKIDHIQPSPFRNTLTFYYGHTAAFYANKLKLAGLLPKPIALWDDVMATGVWPKATNAISHAQNWPTFPELKKYRQKVFNRIIDIINSYTFSEPIKDDQPIWALLMGIEHEFIHFQTSISLIRQAPLELVCPPSEWNLFNDKTLAKKDEWLSFSGGKVSFGRKPAENDFYGWDNEYGLATCTLEPFRVKKYPVTNRDFMEFVKAGGYTISSFWTTPEVDVWMQELAPKHPASWIKEEGNHSYRYRAPFEVIDMPLEWPVEVNKHEAVAYANWANARLINEAEFQYLLIKEFSSLAAVTAQLPNMNVNMHYCSPVPVGQMLANTSPTGVDLFGNVAHWINGSFQALVKDQFTPHKLYPNFSESWFRGDHSLLLGAGYTALGHLAHMGLMRDFMQNHMDQVGGITLVVTDQ